jgi:alpha-galactosidase
MEILWEKMYFWKSEKKLLKEGKDYIFVDSPDKKVTAIVVIDGKYKDVVYHYHRARVKEEGEIARLEFGFTILHPGNYDIDALTNDEDFSTLMGDILTSILLAKEQDDKIRSDYSQESFE